MSERHFSLQHLSRRAAVALGAASLLAGFAAAPAWAQQIPGGAGDYTPQRGQAGKDVVWVPTPDELVTRMLQLGGVTANDFVMDLGAGDGKIVIAAAKQFGARGVGIEYNPEMVAHAAGRVQAAGVQGRASVVQGDIFETDLSKADVITMYLLPTLNIRLRPTLMQLKPGTRLVTHAFTMGGWEPDETSRAGGATAYLWLVPANATGNWQLTYPQRNGATSVRVDVTAQRYQFPEGMVQFQGMETSLRDARVAGDRVRFGFTGTDGVFRRFDGRISGNRMQGNVTDGQRSDAFTAERRSVARDIDMLD
ncbi:MAG: class I SAM-dependent methyltransferase [Pseudomonadota bacterium]|nr:class I SAM-dependent methyltransferase [Pseudomonadota bacterium]